MLLTWNGNLLKRHLVVVACPLRSAHWVLPFLSARQEAALAPTVAAWWELLVQYLWCVSCPDRQHTKSLTWRVHFRVSLVQPVLVQSSEQPDGTVAGEKRSRTYG